MRSLIALAALPIVFAAPTISTRDSDAGTDKYIVVMKPSSRASAEHILQPSGILKNVYPTLHYNSGSFQGFAASLNADQVTALSSHSDVGTITYSLPQLNLR
jgi:hypothetical protein